MRTLNVIDSFSREYLAIAVGHSLGGHDVVRLPDRLVAERGARLG